MHFKHFYISELYKIFMAHVTYEMSNSDQVLMTATKQEPGGMTELHQGVANWPYVYYQTTETS